MKTALLSDIHANLHALEACLAHAREQGAGQFALLGDLVGYGGQPGLVLDRVMTLVQQGAQCVRGNHDAAVLAPVQVVRHMGDYSAQWVAPFLNDAHRTFLAGLPLQARLGAHALLVHASADDPGAWHYTADSQGAARSMAAAVQADAAVRHVFCGHVHEQVLYRGAPGARLTRAAHEPGVPLALPPEHHGLAVVGSCGQPRDGDCRAMYALWDEDYAQITFHRVPYDHLAAAAAVRDAGLPEFFAMRLERGR